MNESSFIVTVLKRKMQNDGKQYFIWGLSCLEMIVCII